MLGSGHVQVIIVPQTGAPIGWVGDILLMIEILHYLKDPKLWELWYIPYYGSCRIYIINRTVSALEREREREREGAEIRFVELLVQTLSLSAKSVGRFREECNTPSSDMDAA